MRYDIEVFGDSPISLEEAKQYLKIDVDSDDAVITIILNAVVQYAEKITLRDLRNNSWTGVVDSFSCDLELRRVRVEEITKIEYILGGVVLEVDPATYWLSKSVLSSRVMLADGYSWPNTDTTEDAVRIFFTTAPDIMLFATKLQMLRHIAHVYENRGDDLNGPDFVSENIDFYKNVSIPNI